MIQLQNISAGYGGPLVVQDVSLDLNPGEVLVLLGSALPCAAEYAVFRLTP